MVFFSSFFRKGKGEIDKRELSRVRDVACKFKSALLILRLKIQQKKEHKQVYAMQMQKSTCPKLYGPSRVKSRHAMVRSMQLHELPT